MNPLTAILGGVLIGLAATLFLALNGRIAGNSGMIHGLLPPRQGQTVWRLLYLAGVVIGSLAMMLVAPQPGAEEAANAAHPLAVFIGGALVGVGTRLSVGCTSGHGVCGIARRSPRSVVATATFMAAGMATVFLLKHVLEWRY